MTEKVKVTREQAEAIEENLHRGWALSDMVSRHIEGWKSGFRTCLNSLDLDDFIRALYIGYEVEPEFKVGDWVVTKVTNHIGKITGFSNITNYYDIEGIQTDNIRHATPSEIAIEERRRFFKKLGREASEYKMADVVTVDGINGLAEIVGYKNDDTVLVTYDSAESELESCISDLRLVVPVENRLDVKTDE